MKASALDAREAEAAVLGAVLLRNDAIDEVRSVLEPNDFNVPAHRVVFETMLGLAQDGYPIDSITLEEGLRSRDSLKLIGGLEGLGKLSDRYPSSYNVEHHARLVLDASRRRRLRMLCAELIEQVGEEGSEVDELIVTHGRQIDTLLSARDNEAIRLVDAMRMKAKRARDEQREGPGKRNRITTGFPGLDERLRGGVRPSWYVLLAAPRKIGKSAAGLHMGMAGARDGHPVLYLSAEMPAEDQGGRALSSTSSVPHDAFDDGPNELEWSEIMDAIDRCHGLPFEIIPGRMTLDKVIARARRWRRRNKKRPGVIVVDYLQLVRILNHRGQRSDEVNQVSSAFKDLAMELDSVVYVLAQLNPPGKAEKPRAPVTGDLREGKGAEMDADLVLLLDRPWLYDKTRPDKLVEIIIALNRHGRWPWSMPVHFDGETTRFYEP